MTELRSNDGPLVDKPVCKRDWFILAALSLFTLFIIACSIEGVARLIYTESNTTTLECLVTTDPATGVHAIPNTACAQKIYESKLITYRFNRCGHRTVMECGPKAPGTYRIVMVGSSFNYGMWVSEEESFAAHLSADIAERIGRKVEVYNEAMQWGFPRSVTLRFNEVLAEEPDMILWPLTPMDIGSVNQTLPYAAPPTGSKTHTPSKTSLIADWQNFMSTLSSKQPSEVIRSVRNKIESRLSGERTVFLLQHFLFKSRSQYVSQYLMLGDQANYLRSQPSAIWQENLKDFQRYFADVKMQADRIGASVVVVMLPSRAQAAMISVNEWPAGFSPYSLGDELRSIVTSQGGTYVDVLADFRNVANPEELYFPVDGHPDARWHALVSRMLAKELTVGSVPALKRSSAGPGPAHSKLED